MSNGNLIPFPKPSAQGKISKVLLLKYLMAEAWLARHLHGYARIQFDHLKKDAAVMNAAQLSLAI